MLKKALPLLLSLSLVFSLSCTASAERLIRSQQTPPAASEKVVPSVSNPSVTEKENANPSAVPTPQQYSDALYAIAEPRIKTVTAMSDDLSKMDMKEAFSVLKEITNMFDEMAKIKPSKGNEKSAEALLEVSKLMNEFSSKIETLYRSPADAGKVLEYFSGKSFEKFGENLIKAVEPLENMNLPSPTQDKTFTW